MKKLIALLLIMVMVIAATACQAKPEAPKTEEMTEEKTEETMEETTEEAMDKLYIPVMAKGFQHQFWQAVKAGRRCCRRVRCRDLLRRSRFRNRD